MRRPRAGIGAELVPLVLILAALAGSLGLIVAVHRRSAARKATAPPAVVAAIPTLAEPPAPKPIPAAPPEPEPEPAPPMPPPPPPEDPTPKALAPLRAAEAEQREEAARADRRAEALEKARKDAEAESDRWKRRETLVRGQLDALDAKATTLEAQMARMAAERDALARRRDAARVALEQARTRPSSAILPHKGPNGTWRRPIAVECRNGMAILQPKGTAFGMLDLAEGFGPSTNPFVRAILREAVHLQGETGPDGSPVVPYIFFVIRPDGIRPYYEARTRLEPLSITFGYELVDQESEVAFPDLDDVSTWDGSAPSRKPNSPLAQAGPTSGPGLDDDLSPRPARRSGASRGSRKGPGSRPNEFTWSMPQLGRFGATSGGGGRQGEGGDGGGVSRPTPAGPGGFPPGLGPIEPPGDPSGEAPDELAGVLGGPGIGTPGAHDPAGGPSLPGIEPPRGSAPAQGPGIPSGGNGRSPDDKQTGSLAGGDGVMGTQDGEPDPGVAFARPNKPGAGRRGEENRSAVAREVETEAQAESAVSSVPSLPTAREISDLRNGLVRPGTAGLSGLRPGRVPATPSRPGSGVGDRPEPRVTGPAGSGAAPGDGPNAPPPAVGSPAGIGIGFPTGGPAGAQGQGRAGTPSPTDFVSPGTIVDRTFELVVACGPRGATIHPGGYRVTSDALNAPDGLLLRQMKGVVKEKRGDDPHLRLEPKVRFLVQPGGEATYRAAKGQVMMSGLGWPTTFQVVGPDPVSLLPSESW